MKYVDLFKLEDCLSSNLAETMHVEVEEETTYEKAFNVTGAFKNNKAKGLYMLDKEYTCLICTDKQYGLAEASNNYEIPFTEKQRKEVYKLSRNCKV